MRIIDLHSHWGTRRGYVLRTPEQLARQHAVWRSEPTYDTEAGMASYFQQMNARVMLDFGFTKDLPLDEVRAHHDYALETQASHPQTILGLWLQIHPREGAAGINEMRRCMAACTGMVGLAVAGSGTGIPASDPIYDDFYRASVDASRPVLIFVGTTGAGAGLPGGGGRILDHDHPRHVDHVAARFPELQIIAARAAWPWQDEMIAIMLHKPNVWCELHGWAPKHLTEALKREIPRRLKHRVMFGCDYPLFRYERIVGEWKDMGYTDEVLERLFHGNAAELFSRCMPGLEV